MPNLGAGELVVVLLIVIVIFGSTKLPQLGDGLGKAIKNFKRAVGGANEIDVTPKKDLLDPPGSSVAADKSQANDKAAQVKTG